MQDLIRFEIVELIKDINNNEPRDVCENTEKLLYRIYEDVITSEEIEHVSVLYRLIFYAYKKNPILGYQMLSGFLQFGQSDEGLKYKPLLDHLAIEAFDKLIEIGGWTVLKECINNLRDNLVHLIHEPIFKHILSRITRQLYEDESEELNPDNLSDICHHLPREKSFTWGWFSYYIAEAYYIYVYDDSSYVANKKQMRNNLMQYRKLITMLRRYVPTDDPDLIKEERELKMKAFEHMEESWEGILSGLSLPEYKWAEDLIDCIMASTDSAKATTATAPAPTTATVTDMALALASAEELEHLIEKAIEKLHSQIEKEKKKEEEFTMVEAAAAREKDTLEEQVAVEETAVQVQAQALADQEPAVQAVPESPEKNINSGWFSWLGWS
jgi:ribosome-associated translation inhibitor RaiA